MDPNIVHKYIETCRKNNGGYIPSLLPFEGEVELPIEKISINHDILKIRKKFDNNVVLKYKEAILKQDDFPSIAVVRFGPKKFYILDGRYRLKAYTLITGKMNVTARIYRAHNMEELQWALMGINWQSRKEVEILGDLWDPLAEEYNGGDIATFLRSRLDKEWLAKYKREQKKVLPNEFYDMHKIAVKCYGPVCIENKRKVSDLIKRIREITGININGSVRENNKIRNKNGRNRKKIRKQNKHRKISYPKSLREASSDILDESIENILRDDIISSSNQRAEIQKMFDKVRSIVYEGNECDWYGSKKEVRNCLIQNLREICNLMSLSLREKRGKK